LNLRDADRKRVLQRAVMVQDALRGARILWIDDKCGGNDYERAALNALGILVDLASSSVEAETKLTRNRTSTPDNVPTADVGRDGPGEEDDATRYYDAIISDIERGQGEREGIRFFDEEVWGKLGPYRRMIFYVGWLETNEKTPLHAFGITNRPDELLHLVFDALERERAPTLSDAASDALRATAV
jgi:hypothetical protein